MPVDPSRVEALVARYQKLMPAQRRGYNEANTRKDFIEPLFEALGWNVRNKEEVDAERLVRPGFADYAFLQHGVVRFYLEAKPLDDDIYQEEYARQVITYAYSKGAAWAVLTNFTRLVAFDALEQLDGGGPRRVLDLHCEEYAGSIDLLSLLTPESLAEGTLATHAERIGVRRRAISIEKRLYESMRAWREKLFNDMAVMLSWKSDQELREGDEAIQRLLDRLIFLRNCEDRGIGDPGLRALRNRLQGRDRKVRVTESLLRLFDRAASTYDSELFQTDALIDVFMRGLGTVVDDTLSQVIEGLYSVPNSYAAYDFALMDADVLGQVYEQYLGHVAQRVRQLAARPTLPGMPAPQIAVEAKRERRKQRGIYYTPKWVVDYIVRQTVGRFLEEHSNDTEAIANLTILDPACGSGSFLIRAYETLLEHHARQMGGDVGHLDRKMREWVLKHNIFGVDLDPQAVEIARLNLLIRMVREEEELPPLGENIRLGNSLISGAEDELRPYFADGWRDKEPFDWQKEFPEIMHRGGFDIVIGNPPYVRIQTLDKQEVAYYNERYEAATGNYDIYALFVERGLQLLRPGGALGLIIPNKFMQAQYGKGLRKLLAGTKAVSKLVDFGDAQIFESGTNYTCLLFLQKQANEVVVYVPGAPVLKANPASPNLAQADEAAFRAKIETTQPTWVFVPAREEALMQKLSHLSVPLGEVCEKIFVGLQTSADDVYIMELLRAEDGKLLVRSRRNQREYLLEKSLLKPLLSGHDIKRYYPPQARFVLLFPYHVQNRKATLIMPDEFSKTFRSAWEYLLENKERLQSREDNKFKHERWYEFGRSQNLGLHEEPKICVPRLVTRLVATYEATGSFHLDNVDVNGILGAAEPLYTLALLNSRLINFFFQRLTVPFHSGFRSANRQFIEPLPIRKWGALSGRDVQTHNQIVGLARRMLDLHQRLAAKGDVRDEERAEIEREIARTDREIDDLVFDLYGLTPEERDLVERDVGGRGGAPALSAASNPVLAELWDNPDDALYDDL